MAKFIFKVIKTNMKKQRLVLLLILCTVFVCRTFAQDSLKISSLKQDIVKAKHDTSLIKAYLNLGYLYEHNTPDSAKFYYVLADSAATKSLRLFDNKLKAPHDSIQYKLWSLKAKSFQNMGWIYQKQGYFEKALKYFQASLKINESIGDKKGLASDLGNIGNCYEQQGNKDKALEYFQKALKTSEEIGDIYSIAINQGYIGTYYDYDNDFIKALEYYNKAIKNFKDIGDKYGTATYIGNIGTIYDEQSDYSKALEYYQKAIKIYREIGNKYGVAGLLNSIGDIYIELKQYKNALTNNYKALAIAKEIDAINLQRRIYYDLHLTFEELKEYEKALAYADTFIIINDSVFNTEKAKAVAEMNTRYETEKKEKQIIQQQAALKTSNLEAEKEKAEKERQQTQRNMFIVAFGLMIVLAVFVFRSNNQKKKANRLLVEQKQEIAEANEELNQQNEEIIAQRDNLEKQKGIIEEIHYEISESINYATRLQEAILPEEKILEKYLTEHFVLFKPKDKVSGDFYWWAHVENHTIITAADCTGHGVPGAFMSMLGSSFLREIVQKEYVTHTGVILRKLRKEIIKSLKQKGETGEHKDGMDMAIISIDHETNIVQFSGANNPLYILTNRDLEGMKTLEGFETFYEIKPDKMPIAIYEKMDSFKTHELQLEKGDQLYMFSDGFADQFGGPNGKKFKYKPFKRLLEEHRNKPMKEQKEYLDTVFEKWKGSVEQVDDVVVLGIKI